VKLTDLLWLVVALVVLAAMLLLIVPPSDAQDVVTLRVSVKEFNTGAPIANAEVVALIGDVGKVGHTDGGGLATFYLNRTAQYRVVVAPPNPYLVLGFSDTFIYDQNGDMAKLAVPPDVSQVAVVCVVEKDNPTPPPSLEERVAELKAWAWSELGMELRVFVEVGP